MVPFAVFPPHNATLCFNLREKNKIHTNRKTIILQADGPQISLVNKFYSTHSKEPKPPISTKPGIMQIFNNETEISQNPSSKFGLSTDELIRKENKGSKFVEVWIPGLVGLKKWLGERGSRPQIAASMASLALARPAWRRVEGWRVSDLVQQLQWLREKCKRASTEWLSCRRVGSLFTKSYSSRVPLSRSFPPGN